MGMVEAQDAPEFFANRVDVEDCKDGNMRVYYYSDRTPPGAARETATIAMVVLPRVALIQAIHIAAAMMAGKIHISAETVIGTLLQ